MAALLFAAGLVARSFAEMAQDLEVDGNVTEQKAHALDIFRVDFSHTGGPLAVLIFILLVGLLKYVFEKFKAVPPSVLLIVLGLIMGHPIQFSFGTEIYLRPTWFFVLLLPPIVADAGFFLKTKLFFRNIGAICTYAVIGTIINAALLTGLFLMFRPTFSEDAQKIDYLGYALFATIVSAVDPVAVLSVFEDVHVNERLFICVFGESLLNDGVTIVLYNALTSMLIVGADQLGPFNFVQAGISFGAVSGMGILSGFIGGFLCVLIQRSFAEYQVVQPTLVLVLPMITYLLTDSFHFSGLLAIGTSTIIIRNFIEGNVCEAMIYLIEFCFRTIASYSESLIFLFLGISVISDNHHLDFSFCLVTLCGCVFIRFFVVYFLTFFINLARRKEDQITCNDQFILAYGGIRGAVCYGLVMSVDERLIPAKYILVSATLGVIIFTTCVQGSTIKPLVRLLKVERSKKASHDIAERKNIMELVVGASNKMAIEFVENLTQDHDDNRLYRWVRAVNEKLKDKITAYNKPKTAALLENHMEFVAHEFALKRSGGTFAGLPTDHSLANLNLPHSKSDVFSVGFCPESLMPPSRPSIPAATRAPGGFGLRPIESMTGIVAKALEDTATNRESAKKDKINRRSLYSRHIIPSARTMTADSADTDVGSEDESSYFTFPNTRRRNSIAASVRKFGKSLKDRERTGAISPSLNNNHYQTYHPGAGHASRMGLPSRFEVKTSREEHKPPRVSVEDEESATTSSTLSPEHPGRGAAALTSIFNRNPERHSSNKKAFIVGEEVNELLSIAEDDRDADASSSTSTV